MVLMSVNDGSEQSEEVDHRSKARWSANKKVDVVMRLLRGESLDVVSRDVGVEAHRLAAWRDEFLDAGKTGLRGRKPGSDEDRRLAEAERNIGELTMDNDSGQAGIGSAYFRPEIPRRLGDRAVANRIARLCCRPRPSSRATRTH